MKTRILARRYAEAFFKAISAGEPEAPYADFLAFAEALAQDHQLESIFRHPLIQVEKKVELARKALGGKSDRMVLDFIALLLKRYRFDLIDLIADELRQLYRASKHIVEVHVRSAVPLTPEERGKLERNLRSRVDGIVELVESVEPELQGGMMVCFQNQVFDATVKTRMKTLREHLSARTAEMLTKLYSVPTPPAQPQK